MRREYPSYRRFLICLVLLIITLALRLPGLQHFPPAIHQDEVSNGVDGWSLLTTGADRSGRSWPVFLEGFGAGDNRTSLYAYWTIPAIALFGPGSFATRLPAALVGSLTVVAVFLFLRRVRGTGIGLVGAILLATNPWHLYLSRFGHEASITPFFLIASLWLVAPARGETAPSLHRLGFSGLFLGAGLYSYPSYRLFLPLILLAGWGLKAGPRSRRAASVFASGLAIAAVPLVVASIGHPERLLARARFATIFGNVEPIGLAILLAAKQYLAHYLPHFLLLHGDGNPLHSPPGGVLFGVEAVGLLLGLAVALRRRDAFDRILLAWFLLFPIASALTLGDRPDYVPHSLRAAVGLPVFQLLAADGLVWGYRRLSARRLWTARAVAFLFAAALTTQLWTFSVGFTGTYARRVAPLYHAAHPPAMQYLAAHRDAYDAALISCEGNPQAYVYAILFGVQTPREYQEAEKRISATETFHLVRRAGDLYYVHGPEDQALHLPELSGTVWALVVPGRLRSGRLVASFLYQDGRSGLEIRELYFSPAGP